MYRGSKPRILPILIIMVVVAVVIAILVSIGQAVFGNKTEQSSTEPADTVASVVLETTADRAVRWTVRGPIVANEDFKSYQITIAPNARQYVVYKGYLDQVISTKNYSNNVPAYDEFVHALSLANIGKTLKSSDDDMRGVCATDGLVYSFETLVANQPDNTLWSSTCKGSPGTLGANALQIQALFKNQIPDFKPAFNSIY